MTAAFERYQINLDCPSEDFLDDGEDLEGSSFRGSPSPAAFSTNDHEDTTRILEGLRHRSILREQSTFSPRAILYSVPVNVRHMYI